MCTVIVETKQLKVGIGKVKDQEFLVCVMQRSNLVKFKKFEFLTCFELAFVDFEIATQFTRI